MASQVYGCLFLFFTVLYFWATHGGGVRLGFLCFCADVFIGLDQYPFPYVGLRGRDGCMACRNAKHGNTRGKGGGGRVRHLVSIASPVQVAR